MNLWNWKIDLPFGYNLSPKNFSKNLNKIVKYLPIIDFITVGSGASAAPVKEYSEKTIEDLGNRKLIFGIDKAQQLIMACVKNLDSTNSNQMLNEALKEFGKVLASDVNNYYGPLPYKAPDKLMVLANDFWDRIYFKISDENCVDLATLHQTSDYSKLFSSVLAAGALTAGIVGSMVTMMIISKFCLRDNHTEAVTPPPYSKKLDEEYGKYGPPEYAETKITVPVIGESLEAN